MVAGAVIQLLKATLLDSDSRGISCLMQASLPPPPNQSKPAVKPALISPLLFSTALLNPKTDHHPLPSLKAGRCPPWCLQWPPKPPQAKRPHLVPRPDRSEPKHQSGFSPRHPLWSPLIKITNSSSPPARRTKRVSV